MTQFGYDRYDSYDDDYDTSLKTLEDASTFQYPFNLPILPNLPTILSLSILSLSIQPSLWLLIYNTYLKNKYRQNLNIDTVGPVSFISS